MFKFVLNKQSCQFQHGGKNFLLVKKIGYRKLPQDIKISVRGNHDNEITTFRFEEEDDDDIATQSIYKKDVVVKDEKFSRESDDQPDNMDEQVIEEDKWGNNKQEQTPNNNNISSGSKDQQSSQYFMSQNFDINFIEKVSGVNGSQAIQEKTSSMRLDEIEFILDGSPRFSSPEIAGHYSNGNLQDLPLLLYLPGIDGTKFAAAAQFPNLVKNFDVKCFTIPPSDRTTFTDLVANVKEYLIHEEQCIPVSRPIYLLGDSLGALLAMVVAVECSDLVDRLILVNPPSSQLQTSLRSLAPLLAIVPNELYQLLPVLTNHVFAASTDSPIEFLQQLIQDVQKQLPEVMSLPSALPADTLQWKFQCLLDGWEYVKKTGFQNIQQRTLIITGNLDFITTSGTAGQRLENMIPRAKKVQLRDRGFVFLQDQSFNLVSVIKDHNFYVTDRRMSSFPEKGGQKIRIGNKYAQAGPIEIPSLKEIDEDMDRVFLNLARKAVSPCFFSTDMNDIVFEGMQNVPKGEQILLIGNHQQLPLDFSFIVEKFLRERGTLIRSLTHPFVFRQQSNNLSLQTMIKYGVVPVSPTNMYKLMDLGESLMMLPGGAVEGTRSLKMKHKLIWPESAEFVRMAAKFNITIVPFSSVGGEEYFEVLSSEDIMKIPVVSNIIKEFVTSSTREANPRAWQGQMAQQPSQLPLGLVLPTLPARYYIKFGKPVRTDRGWVKDKEKCSQIYQEVKNSVQDGMDYLLLKRKEDPYQEFIPRVIYETSWDFKTQAPTFTP